MALKSQRKHKNISLKVVDMFCYHNSFQNTSLTTTVQTASYNDGNDFVFFLGFFLQYWSHIETMKGE